MTLSSFHALCGSGDDDMSTWPKRQKRKKPFRTWARVTRDYDLIFSSAFCCCLGCCVFGGTPGAPDNKKRLIVWTYYCVCDVVFRDWIVRVVSAE